MKNSLIDFCKNININEVGIAPVGPFQELRQILEDRINKGRYTGMEEQELDKRIDPTLTLANAKSIIVCLFPYFSGNNDEGNLSKYARPIDYHIVVKERLKQIQEYLSSQINDFQCKGFVDNGPLVDRYLAYLAGLGYFGINNNLINDKLGSYFFIGYIINNYDFPKDSPILKSCSKCKKCISACPGKCILDNFDIDPNNCASYLTQKKSELSEEEEIIIRESGKIFGCDICQNVCPHNYQIEKTV